MNIFSRLLGSDKAIDAGLSGIDKAFYTAEEKADDALKAVPLKIALLKAYYPFRIAQRFLALTFSIPYVLAWMAAFMLSCFGVDVSAQERLLDGTIKEIVWTIVGFYFLGGAGEGIVKSISILRNLSSLKGDK